MGIKWKEEQRRGEKEPYAYVGYSTRSNREVLTVHRHIHAPGKWFVSCTSLSIQNHDLKATEIDAAKKEAEDYVINSLKRFLDNFQ